MQLNCTYHRAIKAIPYEVVFSRKPEYKRTIVGSRDIDEDDIVEEIIEDEADDSIIASAVAQQQMEARVQDQMDRNRQEHDRLVRRIESRPDDEEEPSAEQLQLEEEIQDSINQQVIDESNAMLLQAESGGNATGEQAPGTPGPSTPPLHGPEEGLPVDPDLLSPRLNRLRIEEVDSDPTTKLRQQVRINQEHANKRSQRQYGKQRTITTYEIGDQVSVAVPALDRASTDDRRIFGRVISVREEYDSYQILTKYGVLDRQYPISELNPLPEHIDIGIPTPPPTMVVTLHHCAAQESTSEKVPVQCNCRDQKTWCSTRRCACIKAGTKCSIACHGGTNQDNTPDCPNISSMATRTQRGLRFRDNDNDKEAKRQRRNTAGRWVASKGNCMAGNGDDMGGNSGSKGGRKGGKK